MHAQASTYLIMTCSSHNKAQLSLREFAEAISRQQTFSSDDHLQKSKDSSCRGDRMMMLRIVIMITRLFLNLCFQRLAKRTGGN